MVNGPGAYLVGRERVKSLEDGDADSVTDR